MWENVQATGNLGDSAIKQTDVNSIPPEGSKEGSNPWAEVSRESPQTAEELARQVKCLLCKQESPSPVPRAQHSTAHVLTVLELGI